MTWLSRTPSLCSPADCEQHLWVLLFQAVKLSLEGTVPSLTASFFISHFSTFFLFVLQSVTVCFSSLLWHDWTVFSLPESLGFVMQSKSASYYWFVFALKHSGKSATISWGERSSSPVASGGRVTFLQNNINYKWACVVNTRTALS